MKSLLEYLDRMTTKKFSHVLLMALLTDRSYCSLLLAILNRLDLARWRRRI